MLRHLLFVPVLAVLATATPLSVAAESLSAADILSKMEEKAGGMNEYQALLNDPDPNRSLAAMKIMLESGDPLLIRMALDHGIFSPNAVMRRTALESYLSSGPILNVFLSSKSAPEDKYFREAIEDLYGSLDAENVGFVNLKVFSFDAENKCFKGRILALTANEPECILIVSDQSIAISIGSRQGVLRLNDDGELLGAISLRNVAGPVSVRIPISY